MSQRNKLAVVSMVAIYFNVSGGRDDPSPTLAFSGATLELTTSSFLGHFIIGSTTPPLALFRRRPWY
jgi:hypothetical protein